MNLVATSTITSCSLGAPGDWPLTGQTRSQRVAGHFCIPVHNVGALPIRPTQESFTSGTTPKSKRFPRPLAYDARLRSHQSLFREGVKPRESPVDRHVAAATKELIIVWLIIPRVGVAVMAVCRLLAAHGTSPQGVSSSRPFPLAVWIRFVTFPSRIEWPSTVCYVVCHTDIIPGKCQKCDLALNTKGAS